MINFLIVAFVIFITVKQASKLQKRPAAAPAGHHQGLPILLHANPHRGDALPQLHLSTDIAGGCQAVKRHRLWWLMVSASLLLSAARADEVVMKNGDRVTGAIVKQDGKTITVKTDNFGMVTAAWDKVASVKSDQAVHVVLKDGKTLVGTVAPSDGKVEITTKDTKVDVSREKSPRSATPANRRLMSGC